MEGGELGQGEDRDGGKIQGRCPDRELASIQYIHKPSHNECVVHDRLHISCTDWQTGATGDTVGVKRVGYQTLTET